MTIKALINGQILTPSGLKTGHTVLHKDGVIIGICMDQLCPVHIDVERDLDELMLVPGFIDLQVNGGGGVLFNDHPTLEGIRAIADAHRSFGTTGFLPTLISDDLDVMKKAIMAVDLAITQGVPGILGIHLEGPFLNSEKRGVHNASKFGRIGKDEIKLLTSLKHGKTLVTLAPETTSPDNIRALVDADVVVCAGHTQADYADTLTAMDAGLSGFTHLFNAMCPLKTRRPGIIAAALEDPRAWCSIIADGHHVHPAMLRLAYRSKFAQNVFLVTDAMPCVGAKDKNFKLGDTQIHVEEGKCVTEDNVLAGSDLDMISAVHNAVDFLNIDLPSAIKMASSIPASFIGLGGNVGQIEKGQRANFCLLAQDGSVQSTWINGRSY